MIDKRLCLHWPYILFCILVFLTGWQIVSYSFSFGVFQYSDSAYTYTTTGYSYSSNLLPQTDYNQLIDLNFTFNILNLVCNNSTPLLLVLIHSAPENVAKRRTIRETWGRSTDDIKVVFMIGAVNSKEAQKSLDKENLLHNDFVQGSFLDTYRNITYKHVMVFKYAIYHCPQAKFILKTDDDVFVNMPTMKHFLTVNLLPDVRNLLFCSVWRHGSVLRSYRSKWRVSFSEYPYRYYPTYCSGWALLYSPDVVLALYKVAQISKYFWIDDVHITGIIAERAHIVHTDSDSFWISSKDFKNMAYNFYNIPNPFLYGWINMENNEIRALWNFVQNHILPLSVTVGKLN